LCATKETALVFNSLTFLIFFVIFFVLYFLTKGRLRLLLCLGASYLFYGWWDWRFLGLLIFSTVMDYFLGLGIAATSEAKRRKTLVIASVVANLSILAFFKYFNFFIDSFQSAMSLIGLEASPLTLQILLPVGISFYTFQSMSYTIDVYRRDIEPERSFLNFATFVVFFPQLVAGPIVRARDFLPQLRRDHPFDWNRIIYGLGLVLLGYFKKVVVADSLAPVVDGTFQYTDAQTSIGLIIGVLFYAFQIYCDFSGYTDIARGIAHMLGYDFPENFRTPYFSRSFSEFWTRWHISLSSWLRDYLYIPLGGNRHGQWNTYRNLMLTMLLGGLWHGANWTFVFWGALHGFYLVAQRLLEPGYKQSLRTLKIPRVVSGAFSMLLVFSLTCLAWIFFRSQTFGQALTIISGIVSLDSLSFSTVQNRFLVIKGMLLIGLLLVVDVAAQFPKFPQRILHSPILYSASFVIALWLIAFFGTFGGGQFIYFQF
jgi:alginate O-acetyltransferase complex protein AlgI